MRKRPCPCPRPRPCPCPSPAGVGILKKKEIEIERDREFSINSIKMATFEDPDELIPCPYDKVHMVQRKKMPYHMMKCRKVKRNRLE